MYNKFSDVQLFINADVSNVQIARLKNLSMGQFD